MTTNEFIELLMQQDPNGNKVLYLRIIDDGTDDELVAFGDFDKDDIFVYQKSAHQTTYGDMDVVVVDIKLDCG
jgi:hypothetical protein